MFFKDVEVNDVEGKLPVNCFNNNYYQAYPVPETNLGNQKLVAMDFGDHTALDLNGEQELKSTAKRQQEALREATEQMDWDCRQKARNNISQSSTTQTFLCIVCRIKLVKFSMELSKVYSWKWQKGEQNITI